MAQNQFAVSCATNRDNLGLVDKCPDLGVIEGIIIAPIDHEFTDRDTALTQAEWDTDIQAVRRNRIYPVPGIFTVTDGSDETSYEDGPTGRLLVHDGRVIYQIAYPTNSVFQRLLATHQGRNRGVYFVLQNGAILGRSDDGTKFKPFSIQLMNVEKPKLNTGDAAPKSMISLTFTTAAQLKRQLATINPSEKQTDAWEPLELSSLIDVFLTAQTSPAATTTTFAVSVNDVGTGQPVLGLEADDFTVTDKADGSEQTISSVADANDVGIYLVTLSAANAGASLSVNLKTPAQATTKGFESQIAVDVTLGT